MSDLTTDEALIRDALDPVGQEALSRIMDRLAASEEKREQLRALVERWQVETRVERDSDNDFRYAASIVRQRMIDDLHAALSSPGTETE